MALGKVYSFGPTFRAEKSKTRRHLTEFWMVEPEVAYAELDDLMDLAEGSDQLHREALPGEAARRSANHRPRRQPSWRRLKLRFRASRYDEAVKMLQEAHAKGALENKFEWGGDLGSPDETYISSQFDKPVMVHRYPGEGEGVLHGARSAAA